MAIKPTSASDIRYAVMSTPGELNVRQIAHGRPFGARTLSLQGPRAVVADEATPRADTFARTGQYSNVEGSGGALATPRRRALGDVAS